MPAGGDPPTPDLPQSIFNALHAMAYDSTALAFKDAAGVLYYMFVEKGSGVYDCKWFYATDGDGGINPRGQIPVATYNAIKNGTYNTSAHTVTYLGVVYKFRLERDVSAGKQIAKPVAV